MLDIFDEFHNHLGTCEKKEVHMKGLWHQVFACLLIDSSKNTVYLQYKNNKQEEILQECPSTKARKIGLERWKMHIHEGYN